MSHLARNTILALAAATALALTPAAVAKADTFTNLNPAAHAVQIDPPPLPFWMTRPCKFDDSVNCYWNAAEQGNGAGHSYYVRWFNGHGNNGLVCVFYTDSKAYAQRNDYCS